MIVPLPENIKSIRKNEALYFYVFLNENFEQVTETKFSLSCYNSLLDDT